MAPPGPVNVLSVDLSPAGDFITITLDDGHVIGPFPVSRIEARFQRSLELHLEAARAALAEEPPGVMSGPAIGAPS